VWLVIDATEQPELVEAVRDGSIRRFDCASCGSRQALTPSLLVYRPSQRPELLFAPDPDEADQERTQLQFQISCFHILRASPPGTVLPSEAAVMPHDVLAVAITRDLDTDMAARSSGTLQASDAATRRYMAWLDARIAEARQNSVLEMVNARDDADIRTALEAHPELLADDTESLIAAMIGKELDEDAPGMADELRRNRLILRRIRQHGIDAALPMDRALAGSARRAMMLTQQEEERNKVPDLEYRDALEQGILELDSEIAQDLVGYNDEFLTPRAVLTLHLARDLASSPRRPADADDAINWCRELAELRESAPHAWAEAEEINRQAWSRKAILIQGHSLMQMIRAQQDDAATTMDPVEWASSILTMAEGERGLEPDGLARAVRMLERSLRKPPADLPEEWRRKLESTLGGSLTRQAERSGSADDLNRAIGILEPVVEGTRTSDPELCAAAEVNLGFAYAVRADWGETADWARAVSVLEEALSILSEGPPARWAEAAANLGILMLRRPDGDRASNLARARELQEHTAQVLADAGLESKWAAAQNNIGNVLVDTPTGDLDENLDLASEAYEQALTVWTEQTHPLEWALTTARLAAAESRRASFDKDKVRSLYETALDGLDAGKYPIGWARTAMSYAVFLRSGEPHVAAPGGAGTVPGNSSQVNSVRQAIDLFEQASAIFRDHGNRLDLAAAQYNRALAARQLANLLGDPAWEDVAEQALQDARQLRSAADAPRDWATTTLMLAEREAVTGQSGAAEQMLSEALAVLREGGEAGYVLRAAWDLGRVRAANGAWADAAEAFGVAVTAIDELFSSATARTSRENILAGKHFVIEDAAFAMAVAGQAPEAVTALENGRGRLLADALQRRGDPFESLAQEHPDAYERYRRDVTALELAEVASLRLAADRGDVNSQARRRAESEVRRAIRTAREALAQSTAALRQLQGPAPTAEDGGLVLAYLLTTTWGSLALVVDADGVSPVWAPGLTDEDLLAAVRGAPDAPGLLRATEAGGAAVDRVLERVLPQLGETLLRPLGDHLEARGIDAVTIVACGELGVLPLHAAPYQDGTFGDRFTVSYAPTRAILRACEARLADAERRRTERHAGATRGALAVSNPTGDLRMAGCESAHLLARLDGSNLAGAAAHRDAVRGAWRQAGVALFACHGRSVADDPMRSHLLLADGQLSLLDLSVDEDTGSAPALVIASACQTAVTDVSRLPDEYIGLAAGFLQSGVSTFIGTMWPTGDLAATLMTMRLVELMYPADGSEPGMSPAVALQRARIWLRDLTGEELVDFAVANPSLREVAGPQIALAAKNPAERPYTDPSVWAAHVLVGAGASPQARRPVVATRKSTVSDGRPQLAPSALLLIGKRRAERGDTDGAREAFQEMARSGHPWGSFNLGVLLAGQGDVAGAEAAYRRAIEGGHREAALSATVNLGLLLAGQGDAVGAQAAYQKVIDSGHQEYAPAATLNFGNLLAKNGDVAEAQAAYQEVISSGHPECVPEAALSLGNMLVEQGDSAGAEAAYQKAMDSGHQEYKPWAAFNLGSVLKARGDLAGAQAAYREAVDSGHREYAPMAAVKLAETLALQEDAAGAWAAYQRAIDSGHPNWAPMALVALGSGLAAQGDVAGAEAAYQKAVDSGHPEYAAAGTAFLGALKAAQGDVAGAEAAYQNVTDSGQPVYVTRAVHLLGLLLMKQEDFAGARAAFHKVIDSDPPADVASHATLMLGVLLEEQGDIAGALAAFQKVIDSAHPIFARQAMEYLKEVQAEQAEAGSQQDRHAPNGPISSGLLPAARRALRFLRGSLPPCAEHWS
jgi:CHAT domain-containing protein/tetratricopeptide (TPR) repeat protein